MRLSYIFNAVSFVFICIGLVTLLPVVVALIYGETSSILPFVITSATAVLIGVFFKVLVNHFITKDKKMTDIKKSEGLATVLLSWLIFALIASIPYLFFDFSVVDAFFEGISGVTTTGATILTHYNYPHTLFFWRSFTQWLGGMGIIILFIAILPQFAIAGRQMFFAEAPGPTEDKLTPRIKNTAVALWGLYIALTVAEIALLVYFKMPLFDAVCNAFSTISSGGMSLNEFSIAGYHSLPITWIVIAFMFLSGCNLALVYRVISQFKWKMIFTNEEFRTYIGIIVGVSVAIALFFWCTSNEFSFINLTNILFTVVSLMTSTGFACSDYTYWAISAQMLLFIALVVGSSAGSTGGGIKIMRALIVFKYLKREVIKFLHPNAVVTIKLDRATVAPEIISQIIGFVIFYVTILLISSILVSIIENNAVIGFTGSLSTLSIIGPAFGSSLGPMGNFEGLNSLTKIIFMFNMLIGRLELVPFLILLNRDFWTLKK